MADSGLSDILKSSFSGVYKMLIGKKYVQNERATRLLVEELLCPHLEDVETVGDLYKFLNEISEKSQPSKYWVQNLIKLLLKLHRAERESQTGQFN